ncbi:hypothetical protein TRIP_B10135 [uncultured Desulfatiglans sp.]|nr:hypothetical protein TRIP_B10135 [uncultured Desulfatiglans sp.]
MERKAHPDQARPRRGQEGRIALVGVGILRDPHPSSFPLKARFRSPGPGARYLVSERVGREIRTTSRTGRQTVTNGSPMLPAQLNHEVRQAVHDEIGGRAAPGVGPAAFPGGCEDGLEAESGVAADVGLEVVAHDGERGGCEAEVSKEDVVVKGAHLAALEDRFWVAAGVGEQGGHRAGTGKDQPVVVQDQPVVVQRAEEGAVPLHGGGGGLDGVEAHRQVLREDDGVDPGVCRYLETRCGQKALQPVRSHHEEPFGPVGLEDLGAGRQGRKDLVFGEGDARLPEAPGDLGRGADRVVGDEADGEAFAAEGGHEGARIGKGLQAAAVDQDPFHVQEHGSNRLHTHLLVFFMALILYRCGLRSGTGARLWVSVC